MHATHEFEALGLRAVLPRSGLVASSEAQVALAGLRLFIDSRDTLAAAQLARAIHYPEEMGVAGSPPSSTREVTRSFTNCPSSYG
ncbi:hypothetical protein NR798_19875 [Archangium gephyra]|uniref:hypothetical protein n=1 Tax=Archangium gephyra TaxID=48 RepID=UPI0035D4F441